MWSPPGPVPTIASTSPLLTARRVSSASMRRHWAVSRRPCRSLMRVSRSSTTSALCGMFVFRRCGRGRPADNIQPGQYAIDVGEVADQFADGEGKVLDERGSHDNLFRLNRFGMLVNVDDLQVVAARQVLFANREDVADRAR